jgi:8-oxo-dGTP diphosphatase
MLPSEGPRPCPPWCTGVHDLPRYPDEGFHHYAPEVAMTAAHSPYFDQPIPLQVVLKSWVPLLTAEPGPPFIEVCVDREPGPELTPDQARRLAETLLRASKDAEGRNEGEMLGIRAAQGLAWGNKVDKGFNTTDTPLEFCLLQGELAEAFDAWRQDGPEVGKELADVAIYVLGLAEMLGVDLQDAVEAKLAENAARTYAPLPNGTLSKTVPAPQSGNAAEPAHPGRPGAVPAQEPGFVAPDEYVASLARKRMAVGALYRDQDSRVLLVDPVYRDTWDLPGGAVEAEESPQAACRREVIEELGLDHPVGRILAVDWVPSRPGRPEGVIVIYDGGVLAGDEIEAITVPEGELAGYEFVHPDQVAGRVTPLVARRIAASLEALAAGTVTSLAGGSPAG